MKKEDTSKIEEIDPVAAILDQYGIRTVMHRPAKKPTPDEIASIKETLPKIIECMFGKK